MFLVSCLSAEFVPFLCLQIPLRTWGITGNHGFTFGKKIQTLIWAMCRIIEGPGSEETLKFTWFQTPCCGQGHLSPDWIAQSSMQPGLDLARLHTGFQNTVTKLYKAWRLWPKLCVIDVEYGIELKVLWSLVKFIPVLNCIDRTEE